MVARVLMGKAEREKGKRGEREAGENCPVVVHRRNGKRWVAIVYLSDLADIADNINRIRGRK